ncbi:MAG: PspC domain-containing protein [Bacteroides sp.]|jgi:phage shock protein PspC (stress-responsive transcriptional regulator)|nr:PspC domain-containing protein [Bacteroides sp.]
MKKTLTVNISGIVFHIDEDAYEKLNQYLASVRRHFTPDDGCDEIMADIESRIAETLQEKISDSKQVVSLQDVQAVISQLGEPDQIGGEEEPATEEAGKRIRTEKTQRRLYRDPENAILGGVAGGLGAYFQVDVTWIRVAFVLFTFVYGFGPLLYLILWIVVPKARSTAEKLEMRGEKVTISNIERTIREELGDVKKNLQDFSEEAQDTFKKKSDFAYQDSPRRNFATFAGNFFRVFFKVVGILIGLFLMFLGVFLLVGFASALLGGPVLIDSDFGVQLFSFPALAEIFFNNRTLINLAIIGIILTLGIPLLAMVYAGARLIFGFDARIRYFGFVTFMLWVAGLGICLFIFLSGARNFSSQRSFTQEVSIPVPEAGRLILDVDEQKIRDLGISPDRNLKSGSWDLLWMTETGQRNGIPRLRIITTTSDEIRLIITKESRGLSPSVAMDNAESISYGFSQEDSELIFDPFFTFDKSDGWRAQRVLIELYVPENIPVEVTDGLRKALDLRRYMRHEVSGKEESSPVQQLTMNFCLPGDASLLRNAFLPDFVSKSVYTL